MENQNEKAEQTAKKKAEQRVEDYSLIPKAIAKMVLKEEYEKGTVQIWLLEDKDETTKKGSFVSGFVKVETSVETLSDIAQKIAAIAFEEGITCFAETKGIDLDDPNPPKTVIE